MKFDALPAGRAIENRRTRSASQLGVLRWRWQLFNAQGREVLDLEATRLFDFSQTELP